MKHSKIYMKAWTDLHGRAKAVDTDAWYLQLANDLLPLVETSGLYDNQMNKDEVQRRVALSCALYLEDCVADAGNWRQFIRWHQQKYGRYLPFYTLTDAYLSDEINREDLAFLLWTFLSPAGDAFGGVVNPMDEALLKGAALLCSRLDEVFELAPISEHLASEWLMETALMKKESRPLPVAVPGAKLPTNVERFMEASQGASLLFFDSYDALKFFFVHSLKWEDKEEALLPDLAEFRNFVVYGNPKGLLIGPDVATFFADKNNPLYNKEETAGVAYELFCEEGLCPFDLLKYGMEHHLLDEAQLPFANGKQLLHDNWDFIARWFLGEYYEGD